MGIELLITDKVESWLREEEIQFNRTTDQQNDLALTLWPDAALKLSAKIKGERLEVSAFVYLTDKFSINPQYFNDLDLALHQQSANFQFFYAANNQLIGVNISKRIWAESLSKTSFFDSITSVKHSAYIAVIKERQLAITKT
jgi:hypothetical protein